MQRRAPDCVEFLQKKGFSDVEANPNTKISDEQYQMLVAEFKKDKGVEGRCRCRQP